MAVLWKRFRISQVLITNLYFFPQILQGVVFAFYIGFGNTLSLDIAFTVITILNLIKDPLRALPLFIGQLIEFRVSMRRIQDYLMVNEVNYSIVTETASEQTDYALVIREGSAFHYGTSKKERKDAVERRGRVAAAERESMLML